MTKPIPEAPRVDETPSQVAPRRPKIAETPTPVDSLNVEDQYDIQKWNLVAYRAGSIDLIRTASGAAPNDGRLALSKGEFLLLSGWAGHPTYGMRFRDVLISLCGKVVGRAVVQGVRPDVASAVHRNLVQSGWSAKLATDLLPRCEQQVLQVWGVAPIGYNIFPLTGKTALSFAGSAGPAIGKYRAQSQPLLPAQNGVAELKKITVRASVLRLRKCGDPSCDVVGHIVTGRHDGYVLESVEDWTLFQIGESVGWASNRYLSIQ